MRRLGRGTWHVDGASKARKGDVMWAFTLERKGTRSMKRAIFCGAQAFLASHWGFPTQGSRLWLPSQGKVVFVMGNLHTARL